MKILHSYYKLTRHADFQVCWVQLIVCIGNGKIVLLHGKVNFLEVIMAWKPTIMLEVVASQDLWIWHAYFGTAGSNNDINVLNTSDVFNDVLNGKAPAVQYTVNRTTYQMGYYLADGIYPE